MSRGMWKTVEAKARKVGIAKIEEKKRKGGGRKKGGRKKEKERKRKKRKEEVIKKTKIRKRKCKYEEVDRGIGNMGGEREGNKTRRGDKEDGTKVLLKVFGKKGSVRATIVKVWVNFTLQAPERTSVYCTQLPNI